MSGRSYYVEVPLRWSDMDALRHINNVQVVRLLEEARIIGMRDWFREADGDVRRPMLLIARQEVDYLRQLHYQAEPVVIAMWVSRIAGASFDISYEIRTSRDVDAPVVVAAETTQVVFDPATQAPQRISDHDREQLSRYLAEPVAMKRRPSGRR